MLKLQLLKKLRLKNLIAVSLALACGVSPSFAATAFPDRLLEFQDTGIIAATNTSAPVHWVTNSTVLVNSAAIAAGQNPGRVDLVAVNLQAGVTSVVAEGGTLLCWFRTENFGVIRFPGAAIPYRCVALDAGDSVRVSSEPATREDCYSKQYFIKSGTVVTDLGRGAGAIVVERATGKDVTQTYVLEDGRRIPLSFPGGHFGGGGMYRPWIDEFSVGGAEGGALRMHTDGTLRIDTGDESLRKFFRGPAPIETKAGLVVRTGALDQFNGDTFFVPPDRSPLRIYKSKGAWDQIGPWSVSPNGCGLLLSMSAAGAGNRVLAFMNKAPQTLHYVDICSTTSSF